MSWLAFETNVLGRIEFDSVAIPFSRTPELGVALKRRGKRVTTNDVLQSAWTQNLAVIQNNNERLSEADVNAILDDAYVPGYELSNPALRNWFSETDAWWFDNVRRNLDGLESPYLFACGASLAMAVGDYALSFKGDSRRLRQPLSNVFRRLWSTQQLPLNNSQNNACQNKIANDFLADSFVDCLFLRLPGMGTGISDAETRREEWLRGTGDFWPSFAASQAGKLGSSTATKSQYLQMLQDTLSIASNVKHWAIAHVDTGFLPTQEIVEAVGKVRRVEAIYTKDFSEVAGAKAVMITA